jgi:hypothetical protein
VFVCVEFSLMVGPFAIAHGSKGYPSAGRAGVLASGMEQFAVDGTALAGAADRIAQAVTQHGVTTAAPVTPGGAEVGHDGLASALESFGARWQPGVQLLAQQSQQFADGLGQSVSAYQEIEQQVAHMLGGTGAPS